MNLATLKENREIIILTFFLLFFSSIYFGIEGAKKKQELEQNYKEAHLYDNQLSAVESKSFYVYDISAQKALFTKYEHIRLPIASITKLMSGLVALDVLPGTTTIKISNDDIAQGSGTGLVVGEEWKLKDLLDFSLITSSNDGMHALESAVNSYEKNNNIVDLMNKKVKEIGLLDTFFINSIGTDVDAFVAGSYSSSYDIAVLFSYILKNNPMLISETKNQSKNFISESNIIHHASNTDIAINNIPGILASKTGFTDLAGGNLAVIFDAGFLHPVVIVVLGSTEEGRFTDVEKLVNITLEKLSNFE